MCSAVIQLPGESLHSRSDSLRSNLSTPPCPQSIMNSRTMTPQRKDSMRASFNSVDATELAERLDSVLREKQMQTTSDPGAFSTPRSKHRMQPVGGDGQKQNPTEIENGNTPKNAPPLNISQANPQNVPTNIPQNISQPIPQNVAQNIPEKPPAIKLKRRPSSLVIITTNGE